MADYAYNSTEYYDYSGFNCVGNGSIFNDSNGANNSCDYSNITIYMEDPLSPEFK